MPRRLGGRYALRLGLGVTALGLVVAGCGGAKSSSSTAPTSTTATLKRLEVQVTNGSTAQAPGRSVVARLAELLGWPPVAEAASGLAGCTVSATGVTSTTTDANGKAVLVKVPVPNTVVVDCTKVGGGTGSFPVSGPATGASSTASSGAVVTVVVEVKPGEIKVKAKDEHVSPAVSAPPEPEVSPPKVSQPSSNKSS